jgi:hypothetical protein
MNTKSLNRAIGLAMSALQQARANGSNEYVIYQIQRALRWLNKARCKLKAGYNDVAIGFAKHAQLAMYNAIAAR